MNISLTPELEQFIELVVKQGRYSSASEVVQAALQLLEKQEISGILPSVLAENQSEKSYNFADLAGKLTWKGDAVEMQRNLRDEW